MSTFNKIYKKVANNGNDADYQVVGQVGVNGVPLDIMKGASLSTDGELGLVPKPLKGEQNKILSGSGTFKSPTLSTYNVMNGRIRVGLKLDDEIISLTDLPPVSTSQPGFMTINDKIKLDNLDNFMKNIVANDSDNFVSGTTYLPSDKSEVVLDEFYLDGGHLYIYQSQMTVDGSASNGIEFMHYRHQYDDNINDSHNFLDSYALSVSGAYYNTITLTSFIDLRSASKKYTFGANSWSSVGRKITWSRKVKIML